MKVKDAVSRLEDSDKFKEFIEENPEHYLVHAFTMVEGEKDNWQLGYYSEKTDKVVVFEMGNPITKAPEEDVLKKKDTVAELDLDKIKMDLEAAMKVAMDLKGEKHAGETVTKKIVILQTLDEEEVPVYNITLVTTNFNLINVKVSAETGEVVEESKESIMKLGKPMDTSDQ